jgi:hypothetical protein
MLVRSALSTLVTPSLDHTRRSTSQKRQRMRIVQFASMYSGGQMQRPLWHVPLPLQKLLSLQSPMPYTRRQVAPSGRKGGDGGKGGARGGGVRGSGGENGRGEGGGGNGGQRGGGGITGGELMHGAHTGYVSETAVAAWCAVPPFKIL